MDNPINNVTDDTELAKVLESMNAQAASAAEPVSAPASPPAEPVAVLSVPGPTTDTVQTSSVTPPSVPTELESIKKDAVEELRPLVDKLDLPADEKFDTLLLIIRSTDDKALIGPAHEAAKAITDETKRAQALLDVIKEIDYFSNPGSQSQ